MRPVLFAMAILLAGQAQAQDVSVGKVRVSDGDTVVIGVRMIGYDTPEKGSRAKCDKERELAQRATDRLRELLESGKPSLEFKPCSCRPDTVGTIKCNLGRACGILKIDGEDVGPILIQEGLARLYKCDGTKCEGRSDWCAQ